MSSDKLSLLNMDEILNELYANRSTHGTGIRKGVSTRIHFESAMQYSRKLQAKEFIPYGPFIPKGTNCSRFVRSITLAGRPNFIQKLLFKLPLTFSPTPMWKLTAMGNRIWTNTIVASNKNRPNNDTQINMA
jgi:hypothetical protein